eukprot:superscaffoldBa00000277_g3427
MSQTKRHYQPHIRTDSSRSLPNLVNRPRESGFHQLRNQPKTETVEKKGTEATPSLRSHSSRETGYTRGTLAPLACPTSLLPSPETKINTPTQKMIGKKEPSGSLLNAPNNQAFPSTPFDCSHFTTHYKSTFCHHADLEKLRSGHTGAGIINSKMDNGYNRRDMDRFIFRG